MLSVFLETICIATTCNGFYLFFTQLKMCLHWFNNNDMIDHPSNKSDIPPYVLSRHFKGNFHVSIVCMQGLSFSEALEVLSGFA